MERIPNGRYAKAFREEAMKMATEGGVPVGGISKRRPFPKSTVEGWIRVSKAGRLGKIGQAHPPLTESEGGRRNGSGGSPRRRWSGITDS